ncbi:hypothetical protein COR50_13500 [Chitinophaga caeni]|uniref:Aminotransferase class I/classII large domain-containing protein n=1 Tax=Chitinophaga caeni TaxID=2029983 RepID=A0A291QVY1_9BACT|nr:aminotransferase class I/II-fold pyridoxal phosphate-dependent enzyme [Chitinophaga caeni]ATL48097.1 hypothetical protein COR50_13500 [Chitinophaga caeni]
MFHSLSTPARTVRQSDNGKTCLFFSGFAYLGMHQNKQFLGYMKEGLDHFGSLHPSSRIANIQLQLYDELEHALSRSLFQQAAASFSSGYLAAQAASAFAYTKGTVIYAPGTHSSLIQGVTTVENASWEDWSANCLAQINGGEDDQYAILGDSVNPLASKINDYSWLDLVEKRVWLVLDDSHGFGILGDEGEGIISQLPSNDKVQLMITASLSKAFSAEGGVVASSAAAISQLKHLPQFTASTPMMPASAFAWLKAGELYDNARLKLLGNARQMHELMEEVEQVWQHPQLSISLLQDIPGKEPIYPFLLSHDILVSSFAYPNPSGPPVNRAVISAVHEPGDIALLATLIKKYYGLIP